MINWDPERRVVAFARKDGDGYDELDIRGTVEALDQMAEEIGKFRAWMERRGPAPDGMNVRV